jgi:site-specific recombinase XerD
VECLKKHRQEMMAKGLLDKDKPVFCNDDGRPIMPRSFNHRFEKIREKAGIDKAITVHSLRHTFATRLLERGVSMKEVQELLRHEEMSTTADIYSHVSEELKRAAAERLTDLFKNGTKMAPFRVCFASAGKSKQPQDVGKPCGCCVFCGASERI